MENKNSDTEFWRLSDQWRKWSYLNIWICNYPVICGSDIL